MSRLRQGIAAGIIMVLAVVLAVALARGNDPDPVVQAVTSTTTVPSSTTTTVATTTTTEATTTTSTDRVAEVQAILQDLWFRWFDAIYRKDADALWEVVATEELHEDGIAAMDLTGLFVAAPSREGTDVQVLEILLDRPDCLVVWNRLDVSEYRGPDTVSETVSVLWPSSRYGWRSVRDWKNPGDLWINDCDLVERRDLP